MQKIYVFESLNSIVQHRWRYIKNYSTFLKENEDYIIYQNDNYNFDFQNFVYTKIIINTNSRSFIGHSAQVTYVVVEDNSQYFSYYVLSTKQIRGCQFELSLKRDLLNDYCLSIINLKFNIYRSFYNNVDFNDITDFMFSHLKNEDNYFKNDKNELLVYSTDLKYNYTFSNQDVWILNDVDTFISNNLVTNDEFVKVYIDPNDGWYLVYLTENSLGKNWGEQDFLGWHLNLNKLSIDSPAKNELLSSKIRLQRAYSEPYFIVAIPRSVQSFRTKKYYTIENLVSKLRDVLGDNVLDIQYTDCLDLWTQCTLSHILLDEHVFNNYFVWLTDDGNKISDVIPIFTIEENTFSHQLTYENKQMLDVTTLKVHQCKYTFRLTNYTQNNLYEFNEMDLTNGVENKIYFVLDWYAKPYQSDITFTVQQAKVLNLFNQNSKEYFFIDSGNKSISANTSQFAQYELDNKNYQNIFNRQLQTQDVNFTLNQVNTGLSNLTSIAVGGATLGAGGLTSLFGANKMIGGGSGLMSQAFDIASYFNSRQSQIDIQNMSIDNIKNRADKPIINALFSSNFYKHYHINVYKDFDEKIDEYERFLNSYGILWNVKNMNLSTFFTKIQINDYNDKSSQPYFRGEIAFDNNDSNNNYISFNNQIFNEINSELSNGVYMNKEVFEKIQGGY